MTASEAIISGRQGTAPPVFAAVCLLAALITGLYGTSFWLFRDRGPAPGTVAAASQNLRAKHEAGDLILLVPHYATRAREFLGDLHPVASVTPLEEDWQIHPRVWVYGLFGEGEALKAKVEARGHTHLERTYDEDGVTVDLYRVDAPMKTVYSFRDNLRKAQVVHEYPDGRTEACDRWEDKNGQGGAGYGRWICRRDSEWFYVAPEWHRMGDHLRLCLWAHPPNKGKLLIRYPNVPLVGQLFGHAGHTLNGALHARAAIDLEVSISGQGGQKFSFDLHEYYRPFGLITPKTGTATVSFAISTPDAGANHFCFTAEMRQ